jgi:Tfp pilus assembly protein PilF
MSKSRADQYYIKAVDAYEYDHEEVLDNLNYALSYDEYHVMANTLMARFYMDYMKDLEMAEEYLLMALTEAPSNTNALEVMFWWHIQKKQYAQAHNLCLKSIKLPHASVPDWYRMLALVGELQRDFFRALYYLKQAKMNSVKNSFSDFIEEEKKRVKNKLKQQKKLTVK